MIPGVQRKQVLVATVCLWTIAAAVVQLASASPYFFCTTRGGVVSAGDPVARCAECQFNGYVSALTGDCVYDTLASPLSTRDDLGIISNCSREYNECAVGDDDQCVPSKRGVLCKECSEMGYLVPAEDLSERRRCVCYVSQLDPKLGCRPGQFFPTDVSRTVVLNRTFVKLSCVAHQHPMLGCFEQVDSTKHKYGTKDPPVPYRCCSEVYGPPPGELREQFTPGRPFEECNTFGGPDPDRVPLNDTAFRTCNGHGTFNFTTRTCKCDREWTAQLIGYDLDDQPVLGCTTCAEFYGPSPRDPTKPTPPYCISIHSPDPVTGREEPCGGHGQYYPETRECVCFGNRTHGYWESGVIGEWSDGGGLVRSCVTCRQGYRLDTNCTSE